VSGELNVPAEYAKTFGEPGQYFVRNERNGLYYSKYGVGNLLFTLPPMELQRAIGGDIATRGGLPSLFLFNLWYVALGCVLTGLLYALSAGYSRRVALRAVFVLSTVYCTFLWFYQRAQSSELYQVILFTGFFMATVSFLRALHERGREGLDRRAWGSLAAVWVCAALLVLIRVVYGLLLPLVGMLALYALVRGRSWHVARRDMLSLAAPLFVPPLVIIVVLAVINNIKFGAPWLSGYHQWRPELITPGSRLTDGVWGFLFSPRFSMFLYFPLLALALMGFKRFAARYRLQTIVMLAIFLPFLVFLSSLPSWPGEWTYGPRYLLFMLPVLSLPAMEFAESLIERWHTWRARLWALVAAVGLVYSGYLQVQVNRLPFFAYYDLRTVGNSPELVSYFYDHHIGVIASDWLRHRTNFEALPYFKDLLQVAPPEYLAEYRLRLAYMLGRTNLYWALPPEGRR